MHCSVFVFEILISYMIDLRKVSLAHVTHPRCIYEIALLIIRLRFTDLGQGHQRPLRVWTNDFLLVFFVSEISYHVSRDAKPGSPIASTEERKLCFHLCLFVYVCLFVSPLYCSKSYERIVIKIFGHGGNPGHDRHSGIF